MEVYHKINAVFKRYKDGPRKGKLIMGDWSTPELEYLQDCKFEFTEKVDGTNIRIWMDYDNGNGHVLFKGRTDNAQIPQPLLDYLEATFGSGLNPDPRWFNAFSGQGEVVLYGEGYGPKIQGGGKYRDDHSFVVFDIKIGDYWLDRDNVDDIAQKLGIDSVPTIGTGTLHDAIEIVESGITFTSTGALKRWGSGRLDSAWGNFEAEGIVARPVVPMFDRKGDRITAKVKAVDFK